METVTLAHSKDKIDSWAGTFINGITEDMMMFEQQNRFITIIDKHQHMHFFTFKTVLAENVNFNVKIHKNI